MSAGRMNQENYEKATLKFFAGAYDPGPQDAGAYWVIVHPVTGARWVRDGYTFVLNSEEIHEINNRLEALYVALGKVFSPEYLFDDITWIKNKMRVYGCQHLTPKGIAFFEEKTGIKWENRKDYLK